MARKKHGGWFTPRTYNHFDYPLSYDAAVKLIAAPDLVARRQFLPLIGFTDSRRRYRTDNSDKSIPRRLRQRIADTKERDIRYASHGDSAVYQFYASNIQSAYEQKLSAAGLSDCVIGYRPGIGSNVDMAANAFAEIAGKGTVTALAFDIEDFFPSILHKQLKVCLAQTLGQMELTEDVYAVFRSVTNYSWVQFKNLANVEGFDPKSPPFPLVKNINNALDRCRVGKLIERNRTSKGIPQGTPISATFANISMFEFDRELKEFVDSIGGSYRRYSDDILLIVPPKFEAAATSVVTKSAASASLTISSKKTEISRFVAFLGKQRCDRPISYLGFCYDGSRAYLRPSTLSRYYRRMTYAARHTARGAGAHGQSAQDAFKRKILKDFSHLGKRNFYSYAKRADSKMPNSIVKKQLRRHFSIILRKILRNGK